MRHRHFFFIAALAVAVALSTLAVRQTRVAHAQAQDDPDLPETEATDMKSYLRALQTRSGANWVLLHGQRAFVVWSVLDDCVLLVELETRDGEPMETSDSTPAADKVRAVWKHGRSEPSTFKRIATWMVPFHSIQRIDHRSIEGRERFRIQIVGLE